MGNICHKKTLNEVDKMLILSGSSNRNKDLKDKKQSISNSETKSNSNNNDVKSKTNLKLEDFILKSRLGKGSFGKVFLVESIHSRKMYAMKVLNKEKIKENDLIENSKVERILLSLLSFPFIVELYCSFQTTKRLFLVTEYMQGGDLFKLMLKLKKFSEKQIKLYLAEILLSLKFLHENNCIYRDLKPENILLASDGHIKLIDFGLTKMFFEKGRRYLKKEVNTSENLNEKKNNFNININLSQNNFSNDINNLNNTNTSKADINLNNKKSSYDFNLKRADSICGTAEYMAPEVITNENYDARVDWFSLGAIAFYFYTGYAAFNCRSQPLDVSVKQRPAYFNPKTFDKTTEDFISRLFSFYPENRLGANGAEEIMNHPYFKDIDFNKVLNKEYVPDYIPNLNDSILIDEGSFIKEDEAIKNTYCEDFLDGDISSDKKKIKPTYDGFTYIRDDDYIIVPESMINK